jgi:hypothetical protein
MYTADIGTRCARICINCCIVFVFFLAILAVRYILYMYVLL